MDKRKEKIILFQGDSITDGNRIKTNEWDLNHQMGHSYAYIINAKLALQYPMKHLHFVNRGISGNRIADLYGRWKEDTLNLKPDVLSILIGTNDSGATVRDNSGSEPERFGRIYQLLLDEVKEQNPEVLMVLCEPFMLLGDDPDEQMKRRRALLAPLQKMTYEIAHRNHAVFVPLQDRFNELCQYREPEYWIWDGVHPTVAGHQIIAEQWLKCVQVTCEKNFGGRPEYCLGTSGE